MASIIFLVSALWRLRLVAGGNLDYGSAHDNQGSDMTGTRRLRLGATGFLLAAAAILAWMLVLRPPTVPSEAEGQAWLAGFADHLTDARTLGAAGPEALALFPGLGTWSAGDCVTSWSRTDPPAPIVTYQRLELGRFGADACDKAQFGMLSTTLRQSEGVTPGALAERFTGRFGQPDIHRDAGLRGSVTYQWQILDGVWVKIDEPVRPGGADDFSVLFVRGYASPAALLSRRGRAFAGRQPRVRAGNGPLHLVLDSTGLELFGQGEWDAAKHGRRKRRWMKLHLGVDATTGEIAAHVLTEGTADDATQVPALLRTVEGTISSLTADGAYDGEPTYAAARARQPDLPTAVVIPPRASAVPSTADPAQHTACDRHVQLMAEKGRMEWQRRTGYGRRALAETAVGRYKCLIGSKLRSRTLSGQQGEAALAVSVLNRMTRTAKPVSVRVA